MTPQNRCFRVVTHTPSAQSGWYVLITIALCTSTVPAWTLISAYLALTALTLLTRDRRRKNTTRTFSDDGEKSAKVAKAAKNKLKEALIIEESVEEGNVSCWRKSHFLKNFTSEGWLNNSHYMTWIAKYSHVLVYRRFQVKLSVLKAYVKAANMVFPLMAMLAFLVFIVTQVSVGDQQVARYLITVDTNCWFNFVTTCTCTCSEANEYQCCRFNSTR